MATINTASSTNNVNWVLHNYGTAIQYFTDRAAGTLSARDSIVRVEGLGMSVTTTNPFTNKSS